MYLLFINEHKGLCSLAATCENSGCSVFPNQYFTLSVWSLWALQGFWKVYSNVLSTITNAQGNSRTFCRISKITNEKVIWDAQHKTITGQNYDFLVYLPLDFCFCQVEMLKDKKKDCMFWIYHLSALYYVRQWCQQHKRTFAMFTCILLYNTGRTSHDHSRTAASLPGVWCHVSLFHHTAHSS